jgi:LmbE family N-acetylglucosaminyl deacetylase
LILAAHPDDEVIGVGGHLSILNDPHVAHVTDGAPRGTIDREGYAARRRSELIEALALGGVPPTNALELGVADQESSLAMPLLTLAVVALLLELRPAGVFTHPYEGGHPDHDATAFLAHSAVALVTARGQPPPPLYEFTSYHNGSPNGGPSWMKTGHFLSRPGATEWAFPLGEKARSLKRRMFDCFGSQRTVLEAFPVDVERFRRAPAYDFTAPAHPGRLLYEDQNWGVTSGEEWRKLAWQALRELDLEDSSHC